MKKRLWIAGGLVLVAVIVVVLLLLPSEEQENTATVAEAVNQVDAHPYPRDDWRPAIAGMIIYGGGQVRTGPASSARMELLEGVVRLSADTLFTLKESTTRQGTLVTALFLEEGRLWAHLTTDRPREFTVETGNAIATVRDTRFSVQVTDSETFVSVAKGEIVLTAQEQSVIVAVRQQATVKPGQPPSPAEPMDDEERALWAIEGEMPELAPLTPTLTPTETPTSTPTPIEIPTPTPTPTETPTYVNQLVMASWWTAGGEVEGLNGMLGIYESKYPDVEIVNGTWASGAGTDFKTMLKTRLIDGDPPDTFQLHTGPEVKTYSPEQYLEPIDDIYASEGLEEVFPADLLKLLKAYGGHYWGVPVNIHRSNVLWYNKAILEANDLTPPTTFDEFFAVCEALQAAGVVPYVMGTKDGWEAPHVFENVLAGTLGAEKYSGLWTGDTPWTDAGVTQALENFKMMLSYANPDHSAHTWDSAGEYLIAGTGAMMIMGDWTDGWFQSKGYNGYGWAPPPGTQGIFIALSDSFALPANAPNEDNARNWLKICGSLEGQEAFNPQKGSICARTDCDPSLFNAYLQSAMVDWSQDAIVASVVHGAAAYESWATDYKHVLTLFVASGDVAATQVGLQQACVDAGICQ